MKLGIIFPQTEIGSDPAIIKTYAQSAEAMGYDYLLAYDHVLGANPERPGGWKGPYTHLTPFHEPFVLFAFLAGMTQNLEFTTGILILPQRQTALVAKQAAEVDLLSGGRLRLGVGIGWNAVEYQALNENFHNRGRRSEEQVMLLRELLSRPLVTFHGNYHTIEDAGLNPLPERRIPIWFGGGAHDAVLERMARLGDGWIMNQMSVEDGRKVIPRLHRSLEQQGRNPAEFGLDIRVTLKTLPPAAWSDYVLGWRDLGATHVGINTMGVGFTDVNQHLEVVGQFKADMDRLLSPDNA